ncbi:MAG: GNAT family N-acetyltransferase [Proteiniphilum sp.]|jgi:ribosomal protein S18 acetylase RimI-like enzyme|nr:GNAT family N-acetyltransferase [Proteiniphilum sp.]MDD2936788.1 GNAT family N-acetyltransferase [Proteiniphilum sp.]MDD3076689.1 GNAT family N-acetyltransferase [Proteiniphilum sp.]MDD4452955.1 GNAT family N-acetyltransferase [Proteiniphilum sp.]NCB27107.1 GNAT family N-acetyltransferase [Bacteroidia bacterium]
MHIERLTHIDEHIVDAFRRLMPQLTSRRIDSSLATLEKVISSEETHLFVAIEEEEIIGTLTLLFYQIPSGRKAWIEDVIVEQQARGKGVGTALMWHAMQTARSQAAEKVDLTSHPDRKAANKLYQKMGFRLRESNVYRYEFAHDD